MRIEYYKPNEDEYTTRVVEPYVPWAGTMLDLLPRDAPALVLWCDCIHGPVHGSAFSPAWPALRRHTRAARSAMRLASSWTVIASGTMTSRTCLADGPDCWW